MTFTINLPLWTVLPLILSVALLAVVLWVSFNDEDLGGPVGLLLAVALISCIWAPILYGRYERWLVVPVWFSIAFPWACWREKVNRQDLPVISGFVLVPWILVIYGRLTA